MRHCVHISELATFNPELVSIRPFTISKVQHNIDCADCLINNVSPVLHRHAAWHTSSAGSVWSRVSIEAAFESDARPSPWYSDIGIVEKIAISVCCRLDGGAGISLLFRNGAPVLLSDPVCVAGDVEEPVSRLGDNHVDLVDLVIGKSQLRADDMGIARAIDNDLSVCCATDSIVKSTVVCDRERFAQHAGVDINFLRILVVSQPCAAVEERTKFGGFPVYL